MSAALGGANTISINNLNAAYKEEDVFGSRMARNTSLILKEEAYLNNVSDPASGSYYIEELTNEMSLKAWSIFKEIEAHGGWIEAIKSNKIQQMIEESASNQEALFNAGELSLIGTNLHPNGKDKMLNDLEISFVKNRTKPTEFKPLHSKRLSEQMDTIRLNEEKNA
jgi:methylmalonyl-CoA mutase